MMPINVSHEVADLINAADRLGTAEDLQTFFEERPDHPDRPILTIGWFATHALTDTIAKEIPNSVAEFQARNMVSIIREQLDYGRSPLLERLLIDQVISGSLEVSLLQLKYDSNHANKTWGPFFQKALDGAHRRYMRAISTLVKIRRMNLPAIQVNIADKQVNIAG